MLRYFQILSDSLRFIRRAFSLSFDEIDMTDEQIADIQKVYGIAIVYHTRRIRVVAAKATAIMRDKHCSFVEAVREVRKLDNQGA